MVYLIVWWICLAFLLCLWARVILSYFSIMPGGALESFSRAVNAVTEPVLGPVRRVLPPARIGSGALDLSPIVVSIAIIIIMNFL